MDDWGTIFFLGESRSHTHIPELNLTEGGEAHNVEEEEMGGFCRGRP